MTKVVNMFARRREENGRSTRVRNTVEVSGQPVEGTFGDEGRDGCTDSKAAALGRMVLDHREGLGLSQRVFAEQSGVSRPILSKLEQGKLYPGGKVRRKLAAAMGMSPVELWRIGPDAVDHRPEESRNGFSGSGHETERQEHRAAS